MSEQLYAVRWADAHGSSGTVAEHEIEHKPYVYTTVGFLVRTDEVGVSIAFELGEDGRFRDVTFVPRAIILEEYALGPLRKPRKRTKKEVQHETSAPLPSRQPTAPSSSPSS